MRKPILLLLTILTFLQVNAQKASDYLCLDPDVMVYYRTVSGDTMTMRFDSTFIYEGDTICYYKRRFLNSDYESTVFFAYNNQYLTKGNYLVNGKFYGPNELDTKMEIVGPNQNVDTSYTISFDMSSDDFVQTSTFQETYVDTNGNVHKNVVLVDQAMPAENSHYITVLAPGIGIISVDGREREFIKIERLVGRE